MSILVKNNCFQESNMEKEAQMTFNELFALACDGDSEAQMKVGMRYLMGSHGIAKDEKEGIK